MKVVAEIFVVLQSTGCYIADIGLAVAILLE